MRCDVLGVVGVELVDVRRRDELVGHAQPTELVAVQVKEACHWMLAWLDH